MGYQLAMISGKQGSGKSSVQAALMEAAADFGYTRAICINFADALYFLHDRILRDMSAVFGIPATTKKDGVLLQLLGTEWGRKVYGPNIWVNIVRNRIDKARGHEGKTLFIIADCRFKNEFDAFPEAARVRLEAPEDVRRLRTDSWRENTHHQSEIDLDDYARQELFDLVFETGGGPKHLAPNEVADRILERLAMVEVIP